MRRLAANLRLLWSNRVELLRAFRPVLVAYAWHCAWVALLSVVLGFDRACLTWIVLCLAGRDAAIGYGLINQRQF